MDKLIVHCSDSGFGTVDDIDRWHKERGWKGVGYHFVITNGVSSSGKYYRQKHDGVIQPGRSAKKSGAHCRGHNTTSLGICLIGKEHFSDAQRISLLALTLDLCGSYSLGADRVYGHYEFDDGKSCPNLNMAVFRDDLSFRLQRMQTKENQND